MRSSNQRLRDSGAGEGRLAQPGLADDARVEGRFIGGESKPGGFEALQGVPEIDPLGFVVVWYGEYADPRH